MNQWICEGRGRKRAFDDDDDGVIAVLVEGYRS